MSAEFKVYDGVPLPEINRAPKRKKYPLEKMKVGQMFFLEGRDTKSASAYISRISRNLPGKFSARHCWVVFEDDKPREVPEGTEGAQEGTGVWRTE